MRRPVSSSGYCHCMTRLRVCLDARLTEVNGGVAQFVLGLAHGLSRLTDSDEEYQFLVIPGADAWLKPYLSGNCRTLPCRTVGAMPRWRTRLGRVLPVARHVWHRFATRQIGVPASDGTIEQAGVDLMHFTFQDAFLTDIPSIYHPHDLQHIHLPEFFTPRVRATRNHLYRRFCERASMVAVASSWGKADLVMQYGLPEERIRVVPLAPSTGAYPQPSPEDVAATQIRYALPPAFLLYPAQTWPHKNHIGLLQALAILRDQYQLTVPFVSCGRQYQDFYPEIQRRVHALHLNAQVQFLGFVGALELQALYRLCKCVVIPTLFEAASFPLWEAFLAGVPTACSNVTSLPEQAADAALVFDPDQPEEIAQAIHRLWTDKMLCRALVERGYHRVSRFTWERTARTFRAHYRRLAFKQLSEEDRALLDAPPLM